MFRRLSVALFLALTMVAAGTAGRTQAQTPGNTVGYPQGWRIAAFTPGTDLANVSGPLYTLQPGDSSYELVQPGQAKSGYGYWTYFAGPKGADVQTGAGSVTPYSVSAPGGQWIMVGNPSGTQVASISGADAVYVYLNAADGYAARTTINPGTGVWALSSRGGTITVTPNQPGSFYALTGTGYQFDVPAEWLRGSTIPTAYGPHSDIAVFTSDGVDAPSPTVDGYVNIETAADLGGASALQNLPQLVTRLMNDAVSSNDATDFQVTDQPHSVSISGADTAAVGTASSTDQQGVSQAEIVEVAIKGSTVYEFYLEPTSAYLQRHSDVIQHVLGSLRLS